MKQVLMTMFNLSTSAGGITRVMMNRGRMFRERGIEASIVTFAFNPQLGAIVAQLRHEGRLAADVPVFNLHAYYAARADRAACDLSSRSATHTAAHSLCSAGETESSGDGSDLLANLGSMRVINDESTGQRITEEYWSSRGHCYLAKHYAAPGQEPCALTLFEAATGRGLHFSDTNELYTHWLGELAQRSLPCAIIADSPWSAVPVLRVQAPQTFRILTIHNNHYNAPFRYGATLRNTYSGILQTFPQADALALLTEAQRSDIEQQFGKSAKIHCIPNALTAFDEPEKPVERDPNLVVAVARYHPTKGLPRIIKAFKRVVRRVPNARLELHGAGEQEPELRELIASLRLERVVSLRGYAVRVAEVLGRASVVVAASRFEGFGLGVAEALSQGTPVVSLDCNYGPAEIITDGVDGYLAYTDFDLSDLMIALLRDPALARKMGEAGRRNVQRFSSGAILERWVKLFAELQA